MRVTELYLHATDKCREVAGLVAARFVTRPDNVQRFVPELLDWTLTVSGTADGVCDTCVRLDSVEMLQFSRKRLMSDQINCLVVVFGRYLSVRSC